MHFLIYTPINKQNKNTINHSSRDTQQLTCKTLPEDGFEILGESLDFRLTINPAKTFVAFVTDRGAFHINDVPPELIITAESYFALKEF